jgi:hypothetical protein
MTRGERAADTSRELGDCEDFGCLLEEVGGYCHVERSRLPSRSFMRRTGDISYYFRNIQRFLDFARNDKWSVPRMLRVRSETVKIFEVCWKKSVVSCIRKTDKALKR